MLTNCINYLIRSAKEYVTPGKCSSCQANNVAEDLKNDMKFGRAVEILETWLSRGDCK